MANRSMLAGLAGFTGVWVLAGSALAAPPRCENITVEDLRRACIERAERCEPLKTAAERDDCYRGRAQKAAEAPTNGPIRLTPNAAPPAAPAPATVQAPAAAPVSPPPPVSAQQAPVANPRPVPPPPPPPPPSAPPPASSAPVVVRPGQPPAVATPAPIPQPAPNADPAPLPKVVRPAPPPPPPTVTAPIPAPVVSVPRPAPVPSLGSVSDGLEAVRGFYAALAQADGARANDFLVPEKRNSGAYEIASMSRYYANMREPVRLLAADPLGPDAVRVRYHYVYVNGRVCDGAAEVSLSRRDGRPLIERIKALNGC
ncbi:hypothetical protein [Azospirillum sp. sgz302134]